LTSTYEPCVCCQCAPSWLRIDVLVKADAPDTLTERYKQVQQEHPIYHLIPVVEEHVETNESPKEDHNLRVIKQ
jgi:tRNA(Arg) A34 adenosine deaminase TadA